MKPTFLAQKPRRVFTVTCNRLNFLCENFSCFKVKDEGVLGVFGAVLGIRKGFLGVFLVQALRRNIEFYKFGFNFNSYSSLSCIDLDEREGRFPKRVVN